MNFRGFLFGSAAALAVVSSAQAADAVVAVEPEPMEYVRFCDAYGTGYFYIPGTETCLKIGGSLRYEKIVARAGTYATDTFEHSRARLEATAKNDSDWGTVYSWIRIQGDMVQGTNADYAKGGSSSQEMAIWNAVGAPIAEQLQSVAIFA